ncbi:MAG: EAL domain-containing protein [Gammaproteobacteria bacterium]|nr:EAL domain-containing protein [Gammaproteobacteria bacterium]
MTADVIKLGLLAPLTGIVSIYGQEISNAANIACAEINKNGGILGKQLQIIIEDDGSLPDSAVPAAIRLAEQHHCSAMIGTLLSNSRIAVSERVSVPKKIPLLNFSFYEGSIYNRYFFHFAALPNQQIYHMIPYMAKKYGPKFFFAGNNYEWPRGSIDAAKRVLEKIGGEIVGEQYFPLGTTDHHLLLEDLANSGANVFVPYAAGNDQLNLLTQFHNKGLKNRIAVVMAHYDECMAQQLPADVRSDLYSVNSYFMTVETDENHRYLKQLSALPGINGIWPDGNGVLTNFGEGTYLCVHAFAAAVASAGSTDSETLVATLENISLRSPQGDVQMDPRLHHAHINSYLTKCNTRGQFEIVEYFGRIPPIIPPRYQQNSANEAKASQLPSGRSSLKTTVSDEFESKIFHFADIALLVTDEHGIIVKANKTSEHLFGYTASELIGQSVEILLPPHLRHQHHKHIHGFVHGSHKIREMGDRMEIVGYKKDGSFFPAEATIAKFTHLEKTHIVVSLRDTSRRKQELAEITWRATHDPLTRLPNRNYLGERLQNALDRLQSTNKLVALMFLDLDDFKVINDNFGHNIGDALLVRIGQALTSIMRPGDITARFGGDEFLILCDDLNSIDEIEPIVNRVIDVIKEPFTIDQVPFYPTVSIGVVIATNADENSSVLLRNADAAMYSVKQEGRNGWKIYTPQIGHDAKQYLHIASGLRSAVQNKEFELVYQPIVCSSTQNIVGAEALLRWRHQGNYISPAIFIPVAEITGSIIDIGAWVFEQAFLFQASLQSRLSANKQPYISINLSARQLSQANLADNIDILLRRTNADPHKIVLEITETTMMTDADLAQHVLHQLGREHGLKLAIDDFGTGHSSLSRIKKLPIDTVKLDKTFVDEIEHDPTSLAISTAVCNMAHSLGLKVTAEGVENLAQFGILRSLHVDNIQGYLFDKPLSADDFVQRLNAQHSGYNLAPLPARKAG